MSKAKRASFGARARVIDMLGREQIADAPTAISELLKNAVDALATKSTVSYNSKKKFLSIDDDGLGMRTHDLLNKWLVIATDSKKGPRDESYYKYADIKRLTEAREYPPLGEKGIGRLAVAALGRGVLIWTRWGKGKAAERTLLFIHWNLFRHPQLGLDDIMIPYIELGERTPTQDDVIELFGDLEEWMGEHAHIWNGEEEKQLQKEILQDLGHAFLDCLEEDLHFAQQAGTLFCILGTESETDGVFIDTVAAGEENRPSEGEGIQLLLGFCDPFETVRKRLNVEFVIDGATPSSERDFWTKEDFSKVDHEISFHVDDKGFVTGNYRRFEERFSYEFQCPQLPRGTSFPGPLDLRLGYVEGAEINTKMSPFEHTRFEQRLINFGSLYVYRDGIRVLPYGRNELDFLRFEDRRSKNAGRYFFSHRRMFGALYLTQEFNPKLRDKAGREGFIKNSAYRGLVSVLIAVFIDLALSTFGRDSDRPDKAERKAKKQTATEQQRERIKLATSAFKRDLTRWQRRLPVLQNQIKGSFDKSVTLLNRTTSLSPTDKGSQSALASCYASIDEIRRQIENAEKELGTEVPAIVNLGRDLSETYDSYMSERMQWQQRAMRDLSHLSVNYEKLAFHYQSEQKRLEAIQVQIDRTQDEARKILQDSFFEFKSVGQSIINEQAPKWLNQQQNHLTQLLFEALGNNIAADVVSDSTGGLAAKLEITLAEIRRTAQEEHRQFWEILTDQLRNLDNAESGELALGALNREVEALREHETIISELAQFGLIVESLDHEYNVLFGELKGALDGLAKAVKGDPQSTKFVSQARYVFDNLQIKLQSLSPLYRRKMGGTEDLSGSEIRNLIERLYPQDEREGIDIKYQKAFSSLVLPQVNGALVMAVTANVVANAIYWTTQSEGERQIRFTVTDNGFVISDSGPGVSPRDRNRVFDAFFGRRPYGRGLGLYIAKTNLDAVGMEIILASEPQPHALSGANFIIRKREI